MNSDSIEQDNTEGKYQLKEYPVTVFIKKTSPPWRAYLAISPVSDDISSRSREKTSGRSNEKIYIDDLPEKIFRLGVGVDKSLIEKKVKELKEELDRGRREELEIELVTGARPVPGFDGKLVLHNKEVTETASEEEQVDHRSRNIDLHSIREGEAICTHVEATEGKEGEDINGRVLSVEPGEPLELTPGDNVEFRQETGQFVALDSGRVDITEEKIHVETEFEVEGDLDYSVGNLDFPGSLFIEGDVLPGFELRARRNIRVGGKVHDANLEAEGNIHIQGGVVGKGEGRVVAGGTLSVTYLNNCSVQSDGDLEVKGEIVNSTVRTDGKLKATSGVFRGGECQARKGVEISELGSKMNVETRITAGVGFRAVREMKQVKEDIKKTEKKLEQAEAMVGTIKDNKEQLKALPEKKKEKIRDVLLTLKELKEKKEELMNRKEELELKIMNAEEASILVRKRIYPGVMLKIGNLQHQVVEPVSGPIGVYEDSENLRLEFRSISMDKFGD